MDLLLIVRDALASSVASSLLTAIQAKAAGRQVAVLFTQEALAAAARGSFAWPRELSGQEMRLTIADRGAANGLPVSGRGEGRQLDVKGLFARAQETGVTLYACPLWASLLGLSGTLPRGLQALDTDAALRLIEDAKRVVGCL